MRKFVTILLFIFTFFLLVKPVAAVFDPATRPNNIFGIHIFFPTELARAAQLVNSSGGDWGYVTVPIQYGDRDMELWQKFMDDAADHHLIPIVRVATEPFYANTAVWRKPNDYDIVDFANFLDSLNWPTENRYVLLFNEVNRSDEWGGVPPDPEEYADFVEHAADAFKSRDDDFFVIAGGFDNASPDDGVKYRDNLTYLRDMGNHNPEAFKKIDGFSSHSYPNPNFAQVPSSTKVESTATYKHELELVKKYRESDLPVFITETGWNGDVLPQSVIGKYYNTAMVDIWGKDPRVIAVTPFVLESQGGPFDKFSFVKDGAFNDVGKAYQSISKKKGEPITLSTVTRASEAVVPTKKQKFTLAAIPADILNSLFLKTYIKAVLAYDKY